MNVEQVWQEGERARVDARLAEAAASYRRVLAADPGFMPGHAHLFFVVLETGDPPAAGLALAHALALDPFNPLLRFNLGNLRNATRAPGAEAAYRQALALGPSEPGPWLNFGSILHAGGGFTYAARVALRVLALLPLLAEAWHNLGNAFGGQGYVEMALAAYARALALKPDYVEAERNRLSNRLYLDDDDERSGAEARLFVHRFGPPSPLLSPGDRDLNPERLLRVGLLTSDFGDHPVGRNLAGFIEHHDRGRLQLLAYDTGARADPGTPWFQDRLPLWRDAGRLSDRAIAETVRADRIDVLVVLAGRFDRNRPLVAAWRPAPVQVAMHDGGPSGMGGGGMGEGPSGNGDPAIAAWITDRWLHPEGSHAGGDRLLRLPVFYNFPPPDGPPVPHRPEAHLVLGSFSNPSKLSSATLALWARILSGLPDARLVFKYRAAYGDPETQARIRRHIAESGGDPLRLVFAAAVEEGSDHLRRYGEIDLALDPFPFSGATTTFEALAMGVPVLTLAGQAAIGRTSAAILGPLGLDELIATSHEDYVARAIALGRDRARLLALRRTIPERLRASPLLDGKAYAAALEEAFRQLWREHCQRQQPKKDAPPQHPLGGSP